MSIWTIGATKITRFLKTGGYSAAEIHSNRSLAQRKEALAGFKSGRYRVLVATDIAARGIDVTGIELVINYDIPEDAENYVHRIGRTGRAGHEGRAISLATPEQGLEVRNIEKIIKTALPISEHPEYPRERFVHQPKDSRKSRFFGKRKSAHSAPQKSYGRRSSGSGYEKPGYDVFAKPKRRFTPSEKGRRF